MNNEELVKSLRTEIQTYLKNTVADLQQEIAGMQERMTAEIERHRGELDKSFQQLLSKGSEAGVSDDFANIVSEHLKIAYDDGSQEAAAKHASQKPQQAPADYSSLRDAIGEISEQGSQADILKALVKHAASFASRGAFFIVKSDHLVGWRIYGSEAKGGDETVREIFLSIDNNTLLGASVKQNGTQRGLQSGSAGDEQYLNKLNFGAPRQMVAVPLVVREKAVAVLYADSGEQSAPIQVEALETLVRVAGLTVELQASAKSPAGKPKQPTQPLKPVAESPVKDFSFATTAALPKSEAAYDFQAAPAAKSNYEVAFEPVAAKPAEPEFTPAARLNDLQPSPYDVVIEAQPVQPTPPTNDFQAFAPPQTQQPVSFDSAPLAGSNFAALGGAEAKPAPVETAFEPVIAPTPAPPQPEEPRRVDTRSLELPVEVPEEERRLHNDARRFARLLVSEIKLYNEQKVKEGRQAGDLYTRLREAVDRSRDMYEKRVAPPVNTKFDYFHYELVNTLAEGDSNKLGNEYPGATV